MKKIGMVLVVIAVILMTGCEVKRNVKADIFPDVVAKIEVYNGGALIFSGENVSVSMKRLSSSAVLGADEYFLIYEFSQGGRLVKSVMDSESLCIVW